MILEKKIDISRMKHLILQNLWHYQQKHHQDNRLNRFTFMLEDQHPLYSQFAQALLSLQREGLVAIALNNGQCFLTDKGFDYCQSEGMILPCEDRFFEEF